MTAEFGKATQMRESLERRNTTVWVGLLLSVLFLARSTQGASAEAEGLLKLARAKFPCLTKAEEKLFCRAADGQDTDCRNAPEESIDPNTAEGWGNERVLHAVRLVWLCTDLNASAKLTHRGIRVRGARIKGQLDLSYARILFPLTFESCAFPEGLELSCAELRELCLVGTHTGSVRAERLQTKGSVFLSGSFRAESKVNLTGATIGGDLDCSDGLFLDPKGDALCAGRAKVAGSIFLRDGFRAEGKVDLIGAMIGGNLECGGGSFVDPNALCASGTQIAGSVFLRDGFRAEGQVNLINATIGGNLECGGGSFLDPNALCASGARITGDVLLRKGFLAEGKVELIGATIGADLDCADGSFLYPNGDALCANRAKIAGSVFLCDRFRAEGKVDLINATIGGNLDCSRGSFVDPNALDADGAKIARNVFLRYGFKARGKVNLINATIGGDLDCRDGSFINPAGDALWATVARITGSVFLSGGFYAEGQVSVAGATIGVALQWRDVNAPEKVTYLDLRYASVGTLYDDRNSWPAQGRLLLHGFVYNNVYEYAPRDANQRIEWLHRQRDFLPQPYVQLAKVLQNGGQEEDARKILIAKNHDQARLAPLTWSQWCWYRILGPTIGYGYQPIRALWGVGVFFGLGWVLFGLGYRAELMTAKRDSASVNNDTSMVGNGTEDPPLNKGCSVFCSLMYSVDAFLPLIDLHQADDWLPNPKLGRPLLCHKEFKLTTGGLLRMYLWFHIIMGWTLSTLLAVSLSGLVRP